MVDVQNTDLDKDVPIGIPLVEKRTKKSRTRGPTSKMVDVQNTDLDKDVPIGIPLVEKRTKKSRTRGPTSKMVNVQNTNLDKDDPIDIPLVEKRTKKRRTRGPTRMREIASINSEDERRVVEYNGVGKPIGVTARQLKNFIGICVRRHIPIMYKSWNIVPLEMKENIIKLIQGAFVVDLNKKKELFKIASSAFRNYKNKLTIKFVMPFKDHPECLECPPDMYSYIEPEHWNTFVKSRLSEDFERISKLQQERRGGNKCNHQLMAKDIYPTNDSTHEQSILFKSVPMDQSGESVDELTQPTVAHTDETFAIQTHDFGAISPNRDVLSQALGTSEHSRRILGDLITPTQYFYKRKRSSIPKAQMQYEDAEKAMLHARVEELEEQLKQSQFTSTHELASSLMLLGKETKDTNIEADKKEKNIKACIGKHSRFKVSPKSMKNGTSCKLKVGSMDNIVTIETMFDEASTSNVPVMVVKCKDVKVSIDVAGSGHCPRPVQLEEGVDRLSQEIDSRLNRPQDPVIIGDADDDDPKKESQKTKKVVKAGTMMTPPKSVPLALRFMLLHANCMKDGRAITFDIPIDVFGVKRKCYIMEEDLTNLCHMREISVTSVSAYMVYLYTIIVESNALGLYKFMDPATISFSAGPPEIRAEKISTRLLVLDPNQLLIVPYNSMGHWLLVVINPSKSIAFSLDSLRCRLQDDIVSVVNMAFQIYKARKGLDTKKKKITWKPIKCPCQSGTVECGYYVMRYMREIICSRSTSIKDLMDDAPSTYTQNQLDDVRIEWAEFMGSHI